MLYLLQEVEAKKVLYGPQITVKQYSLLKVISLRGKVETANYALANPHSAKPFCKVIMKVISNCVSKKLSMIARTVKAKHILIVLGETPYIHTSYITFVYPRICRVAYYTANISEHFTVHSTMGKDQTTTTGTPDALLFTISLWVLLRPLLNVTRKMQETGPTVYRPSPRRLEYLSICRCHCKGSIFSSVILRP